MNFVVEMVDVYQDDGSRSGYVIFEGLSVHFRRCDHDLDCGSGDTSDETGCGK